MAKLYLQEAGRRMKVHVSLLDKKGVEYTHGESYFP